MSEDPTVAAPPPKKRGGLLRSSAIFSGLTLVSRFTGLASSLVITAKLGASQNIAADAYYTALTFPNLFRRIFAEGAFAAAFVPGYSRKLAGEGDAAADRLATDALATLAAATILLTLVAQLAMPWIMHVYSPGFLDDPAKFKLTVILTQITMPYLPCMAIAALFSGVLNARGRFAISGGYPTILNLVMLAIVLPQDDPVRTAYAASVGVILAGIGQAGLCWWGVRRTGARIGFVWPRLTPDIKALMVLAIPAAIANSATQLNMFISGFLASEVDGMRVWMNVADRIYQLPMSLVGVAIGVALLPRLSQALQADDRDDAQGAMDQGIVFSLAFSLPAAAALMALPIYLIDGLFTRGEFTAADSVATGQMLFHYAWGVPAFVLLRVLQPAFFARQDTRTPMRFSLISVAVNIVLGVVLFRTIGFIGVAIATSFAAWVTVLQMWVALSRRDIWRLTARGWSKVARVTAASLAMGGLLWVAGQFRAEVEGLVGAVVAGGVKEVSVLALCVAGATLYPVLLFAFGGVTPSEARAVLLRRGPAPDPPADLP